MSKNNSLEISVNEERAAEVVEHVMKMFNGKYFPFNKIVFPDTVIPEKMVKGSRDHALMLFIACSLDSMSRSEQVYGAIADISKRYSLDDLFSLEKAGLRGVLQPRLGDSIEDGINKPVEVLKANLSRLDKFYGKDPRKLGQDTIEKTLKSIQMFRQFGSEKSALLMKNYVRFDLWDFKETEIPIKIDRHVLRISLGAGIVNFPSGTEKIRYDKCINILRRTYQEVTSSKGISAIDLDDAMWGIGSQMCVQKSKFYCDYHCPIGCEVRPWLDKKTTWFYLKRDSRKNDGGSLFKFEY